MRHLSRHLEASIQDHVEAFLTELLWIGSAATTPFNAKPVTFQRLAPEESALQSVQPNLVAVSFGLQTDDEDEELGGGLVNQEHVVFVDVYAENHAIGLALAEDIRDLLVGRASYGSRPASRFLRVSDHSTVPPTLVPGYQLEMNEILREPSDRRLLNCEWQIVRGTAKLYLPGES